jgi:hypothetical protein
MVDSGTIQIVSRGLGSSAATIKPVSWSNAYKYGAVHLAVIAKGKIFEFMDDGKLYISDYSKTKFKWTVKEEGFSSMPLKVMED